MRCVSPLHGAEAPDVADAGDTRGGIGRRAEIQKGNVTASGGPENVRAGSDRGQLQRARFVVSLLCYAVLWLLARSALEI